MNPGITTVLYPVTDASQAKELFGNLPRIEPHLEGASYVGFKVADQEIALVPNGHNQGMTGPVGYYEDDDIKQWLAALLDAGAQVQNEVRDVGGGKLVATVKDADGNIIGLIQPA